MQQQQQQQQNNQNQKNRNAVSSSSDITMRQLRRSHCLSWMSRRQKSVNNEVPTKRSTSTSTSPTHFLSSLSHLRHLYLRPTLIYKSTTEKTTTNNNSNDATTTDNNINNRE